MKANLTPRRAQLLAFIIKFLKKNGYPPSYREMMSALNFRSPNGVAQHLRILESEGYLTRGQANTPRTLKVVIKKGSRCPVCGSVVSKKDLNTVHESPGGSSG